jgi:ribosomal protein S18 acetylase RimI-like enzyme
MYYLGELVLLPEYRKQGIGSALYLQFEAAVKEMRAYSKISLCQMEDSRYESLKTSWIYP